MADIHRDPSADQSDPSGRPAESAETGGSLFAEYPAPPGAPARRPVVGTRFGIGTAVEPAPAPRSGGPAVSPDPDGGPTADPARRESPVAARDRRSLLALLGVPLLGVLVAWQVALAGSRLPAAVGETRIGPGVPEFAARFQLAGYAWLTGAADRYPDPLGGARELALVATVVLVVSLVALVWRAAARPVAVAVVLVLVAVCPPAVAVLAVFGPGLLGVAWLALGATLLAARRRVIRVSGAVAVVIGVVTAPVLIVPMAVAVVVLTAQWWSPAAEVAAALAMPALVLALIVPMMTTGLVLGPAGLGTVAAAGVVVVAGVLVPRLRVAAAATAVVLVLAALPWSGYAAALPAAVVAAALMGVVLLGELGGWLAARPPAVRRIVAIAAVSAASLALAVVVVPDLIRGPGPEPVLAPVAAPAPPPAVPAPEPVPVPAPVPVPVPAPVPVAQRPYAAVAVWIAESTDRGTTLTAAPDVRADLIEAGVPADRFRPAGAGTLVVRAGSEVDGSALTRFGSGPEALDVAAADPRVAGSVAAEAGARRSAGTQLAANTNLVAAEEVRAVLRAGGLDSRALVLLAGLAGQGPVTVTDLPVVPGEDPTLPRHRVAVAGLDEPASAWLEAQRPPFAPARVPVVAGSTTLVWPLPPVPGLLG